MKKLLCLFILVLTLSNGHAQRVYDARIGGKEILTPLPNKEPRINGPKVYGARPGKEFVFRIPCQGERPMKFEIVGLTNQLILDTDKGIITGNVPEGKGEYPMRITASNKYGKVSREFKLVVGDKLALTPPTGWNSWGGHMLMVTDGIMRKTADVFVEKGFADVGFQYISIDDCWMKTSKESFEARKDYKKKQHEGFSFDGLVGEVRNTEGNVIPNSNFPDMKAMTDYIHSFGLKAGIYSSPGPYTCQNFEGSLGYEKRDADQYANWGFDLLKYDLCSGNSCLKCIRNINESYPQSALWQPMATYLSLQDRDILFNLCQYGFEDPWTWAPDLGISTWRTGGDLNHHVENYFKEALRISTELRAYSKPGQWNDPDFMYIHKLRDFRKMVDPSQEIALNTNQRYQYVTLWSVICAPFFFSCDINEIDEFTIRLLANAGVMNINQDALGHVAETIKNKNDEVIMLKRLADGSKALAVFNTSAVDEKVIDFDLKTMGLNSSIQVYDVWRQDDLGTVAERMSIRLSPNGVGLFILKQ
ncbi:alpha-galactosidase [Maribacter sp. ANRC-HE7]|uniref:Alpha-galactosidase n=1 Tax=Maribacter aquimaris TaxID=2737171 RepID=A0ABR7V0I7_9FLAO|nr:glycoside hydrolase family 27 protein [Maribacter aquimaris]MBD0777835.1 alpha-galactosidase [Maribacter aquimaris]